MAAAINGRLPDVLNQALRDRTRKTIELGSYSSRRLTTTSTSSSTTMLRMCTICKVEKERTQFSKYERSKCKVCLAATETGQTQINSYLFFRSASSSSGGGGAAGGGPGATATNSKRKKKKIVSADGHFKIPAEIQGRRTTTVSESSWKKWAGVDSGRRQMPTMVAHAVAVKLERIQKSIKTVTIPESVTSIGVRAFKGCSSLREATIPDAVASIEDGAFSWCPSLTTVHIPDSVAIIGRSAFSQCRSLTEVAIPEGVVAIEGYTFNGCSALATMIIPESVTRIEKEAFGECSSLKTLLVRPAAAAAAGAAAAANGAAAAGVTTAAAAVAAAVATGAGAAVSSALPDAAEQGARVFDVSMWSKACDPPVSPALQSRHQRNTYGSPPFAHVTRIWAPDAVINQLTGPFSAYSTLADVPRVLRAAPDATTWAGVQLWMWWLPPSSFSYGGGGSVGGGGGGGNGSRVVCTSRTTTIWTTMLSAYKSSEVLEVMPDLEPELWEHIFTFLKHDQRPVFI